MSLKLWVGRDKYNKESLDNAFCFYISDEHIDKVRYDDGTVMFHGASFELSDPGAEVLLKKAGLELEPAEGPVRIEVTIRRV